jgi:hypothetical protein
MTIVKPCPYCDIKFAGHGEVCSDCQEHFKGIFLCRAEKLTYEQKVSLGRYIMYLKKKDDEKKDRLSNPAMIYKGLKPLKEYRMETYEEKLKRWKEEWDREIAEDLANGW